MNSDLRKNVILEGIFGSETPDTSGEVLSVSGADISELQTGRANLNTEHINPEDLEKDGFDGFMSIVGRVINAKKIFSEKDCETDKELLAWKRLKRPMIYGQVEIFDGPDAHDNARAVAALARIYNGIKDGPKLGLSVEGQTLKRDGKILERTAIRRMAITAKPCNRTATIDLVKDTQSPNSSSQFQKSAVKGDYEPLRKSVDMQFINVQSLEDFGLSEALTKLRKALTAGMLNAAPSSLVGGAALQKQSQLDTLVKVVGKKLPTRDDILKAVPDLSNDVVDSIIKVLKMKKIKKIEKVTKNCYEKMVSKSRK